MAQTLENVQKETRWTPISAEDRELVRRELEAIVSSYHFKGSRRYPVLLKYVVDAALDNRVGGLKERTLGVEVFARDPDYDTNADPVVRVSAGEVRKRIAQYYHENGHASRVQIELPLGSYAPEFLLHEPRAENKPAVESVAQQQAHVGRHLRRAVLIGLASLLLLGAAAAAYFSHQDAESGAAAAKRLWDPLFQSTRPMLIVVGTSHPDQMAPETAQTTFGDHMSIPYHHVSVSSAIALARLGGVLHQHGKDYEIKEATETSLTDMRSRSLILVGAMNNEWTMRLLRPFRIYLTYENFVASIRDARNPQQRNWSVDFKKPYGTVTTDYAIVARYRDPNTEGPVMVIAGLGPYGTEAASDLVQSPQYLAELAAKLPRGWENKNLEVVIKTNVIGVNAGPPILISAVTW
jgi:hypothetical protein